MKVIRYAVKMKNGSFMVQEIDDSNPQILHIHTVDSPIDADLLRSKDAAQRCVNDIPSGNTNLMVLYDDDNPPEKVMEIEINCRFYEKEEERIKLDYKEINELIMEYQLEDKDDFCTWVREDIVPKLHSFIPLNRIESSDELAIFEQMLVNAFYNEVIGGSYSSLSILSEDLNKQN
ncbi:hypothetical protein [Siminovitchia fordii]|uniref:Uncharacterized protein n=1 Tax=Siminovitchia fordii TaxID=254759 RepID=A0ABQ4KBT3_9BACI|nr:hypothetical protein [Siminovitchia fordii]GIN22550.1 hypothetical protein J1TS3_36840 [Siminovitchia fordii]